jgi:hypothetical protein
LNKGNRQRFVLLIGGKRPGRHNGPELFRIKYDVGPGGKPCILAVGNQTAGLFAIGFQQLIGYVVRADDLHHLFQGGHDAVQSATETLTTLAHTERGYPSQRERRLLSAKTENALSHTLKNTERTPVVQFFNDAFRWLHRESMLF